jgi:hypothetical protein
LPLSSALKMLRPVFGGVTTKGGLPAPWPCSAFPGWTAFSFAMRAERKVIDKIVDGLKFHS